MVVDPPAEARKLTGQERPHRRVILDEQHRPPPDLLESQRQGGSGRRGTGGQRDGGLVDERQVDREGRAPTG